MLQVRHLMQETQQVQAIILLVLAEMLIQATIQVEMLTQAMIQVEMLILATIRLAQVVMLPVPDVRTLPETMLDHPGVLPEIQPAILTEIITS